MPIITKEIGNSLKTRKFYSYYWRKYEDSNRRNGIMLLTPKAYEIKEMELETLKKRLKEARREKALAIAQADGDSRHDNFGFEQAEIQERAVIKEINDLTRLLQDAEIVEEKANSNTVDVGSRVEMELNYGDGDVETVVLKLQPLPSDESGVVTLNSPIGRAIFGQKENFCGECKLGGGNIVKIHILKIL